MVDVSDTSVPLSVRHVRRSIVTLPPEVLSQVDGDEISSKERTGLCNCNHRRCDGREEDSRVDTILSPTGPRQLQDYPSRSRVTSAVIECRCKVTHKTGVEMEALTGASVAALTVYDMLKGFVARHRHSRDTRLDFQSPAASGSTRAMTRASLWTGAGRRRKQAHGTRQSLAGSRWSIAASAYRTHCSNNVQTKCSFRRAPTSRR